MHCAFELERMWVLINLGLYRHQWYKQSRNFIPTPVSSCSVNFRKLRHTCIHTYGIQLSSRKNNIISVTMRALFMRGRFARYGNAYIYSNDNNKSGQWIRVDTFPTIMYAKACVRNGQASLIGKFNALSPLRVLWLVLFAYRFKVSRRDFADSRFFLRWRFL